MNRALKMWKELPGPSEHLLSPKDSTSLKSNFGSRVVPFNLNRADAARLTNDSDFEDLSLIRRQLKLIENQQSNLLDLLQRFIGSSQKGMSSLEKRIDGLERMLDGISRRSCGGKACCMIAGAEFVSPKLWRKGEGQTCSSRVGAVAAATQVSYSPRN